MNEFLIPTSDDVKPVKALICENRVSVTQSLIPANRVTLSEPLTEVDLIPHEGRRHWVYTDSTGHPTIGIGSNLDSPDAPAKLRSIGANYSRVLAHQDPLSNVQIDALFAKDLQCAIEAAHRLVPRFEDRPFPVQCVVVELCFNLGATGFCSLRSFRSALNRDNYAGAASALVHTTWHDQVGARAEEMAAVLTLVNKK